MKKSSRESTSTVKPGKHTRQEVNRILTRDAQMGRHNAPPSKKQQNKMRRGC